MYLANHFLIEVGKSSLISCVTLPVGTPTGVTAAATATELALTATAVTVVAATAFGGGGTHGVARSWVLFVGVSGCSGGCEGELVGVGDVYGEVGVGPDVSLGVGVGVGLAVPDGEGD